MFFQFCFFTGNTNLQQSHHVFTDSARVGRTCCHVTGGHALSAFRKNYFPSVNNMADSHCTAFRLLKFGLDSAIP